MNRPLQTHTWDLIRPADTVMTEEEGKRCHS
jgi:hypothetical protein